MSLATDSRHGLPSSQKEGVSVAEKKGWWTLNADEAPVGSSCSACKASSEVKRFPFVQHGGAAAFTVDLCAVCAIGLSVEIDRARAGRQRA